MLQLFDSISQLTLTTISLFNNDNKDLSFMRFIKNKK